MLQRCLEGDTDDDGIYVEFFQEIASGYDILSECSISKGEAHFDFREPFAGITGVDVLLNVDGAAFAHFAKGLKKVFHGRIEQLRMGA